MEDEQRLANLLDALADSVEEMTDEEILDEARAEGDDPKDLSAKVAGLIDKAIRKHDGSPVPPGPGASGGVMLQKAEKEGK